MVLLGWHQSGGTSPWGDPRRSCTRPGAVLFSSCDSGSLFWASWARLGVLLGCSWDTFDPSWALLGSLRRTSGSIWSIQLLSGLLLVLPALCCWGLGEPGSVAGDCAKRLNNWRSIQKLTLSFPCWWTVRNYVCMNQRYVSSWKESSVWHRCTLRSYWNSRCFVLSLTFLVWGS